MTNKRRWLWTALLCALAVVCASGARQERTLYVSRILWMEQTFKEPFETAIFEFANSTEMLAFSTHEAERVGVSLGEILEVIKEYGHSIKDCIRVIHNHWSPVSFTSGDIHCLRSLMAEGFTGKFQIYHSSTGKVETYGEAKK